MDVAYHAGGMDSAITKSGWTNIVLAKGSVGDEHGKALAENGNGTKKGAASTTPHRPLHRHKLKTPFKLPPPRHSIPC
ncbi:hypothetical protein CDAR_365561 [Caerostris darwini]|uniref:Uncharacterized protein n=1 Tax=Caerostris darwini TaxID=1538125 RepID=A0AAV4RI13_9ARAC|nr:hypothetical protein CDAR_365561 [Caerostris darwini]